MDSKTNMTSFSTYKTNKHVNSIKFSKGRMHLSCSMLTGKIWDGSLKLIPISKLTTEKSQEVGTEKDFNGQVSHFVDTEYGVSDAEYLPSDKADEGLYLIGGDDGSIRVYAYKPSNKSILRPVTTYDENGNPATFEEKSPFVEVLYEHSDVISSIQKNPVEDNKFASSSWDNAVHFWKLSKEGVSFISSYLGHSESVYDIKWSLKDQNSLYTCSSDYFVKHCDTRDTKNTKNIIYEADSAVFKLATNPLDPYVIAAACDNGDGLIIDVRKPNTFVHKLASTNESALCLDYSLKGALAVGREKEITVYNPTDYSVSRKIKTSESISSLRWGIAEIEHTLVYATYDRTLNYAIWNDIF